jgi:hypothetical protein
LNPAVFKGNSGDHDSPRFKVESTKPCPSAASPTAEQAVGVAHDTDVR